MKYPSIYLRGEGATAEVISVAVAAAASTRTRCQGDPPRPEHAQPHHQQVDLQGRRPDHVRGQLKVVPGATGVVASVRCDALLLDEGSRSDTYPYIDIQEDERR